MQFLRKERRLRKEVSRSNRYATIFCVLDQRCIFDMKHQESQDPFIKDLEES